jgi:hypothetical protein
MIGKSLKCKDHAFHLEGLALTCEGGSSDHNHYVIVISDKLDSLSYLISVIAHEISHILDFMFERAMIDSVHTELRAYYLDFFLAKALLTVKF